MTEVPPTALVPITKPGPLARVSAGVGLRLLVATIGLPMAALVFLGAPAFLLLLGMFLLHTNGATLDESGWTERGAIEGGVALAAVGAVVFLRSSWGHRRARWPHALKVWLILGAVLTVAAGITLGLEVMPRSDLNPPFPYAMVIALGIWFSLSLAWGVGRLVSFGVARAEAVLDGSAFWRGVVTGSGPTLALGVGATLAVALSTDVPDAVVDSIESAGAGVRDTRRPSEPEPEQLTFETCIDLIYADNHKLWREGVSAARGQQTSDPENAATEAALVVCRREPKRAELHRLFTRKARDRGRDTRRTATGRRRTLATCSAPWTPPEEPADRNVDPDLVDCMLKLVCQLSPNEKEVLELWLDGLKDKEIGARLQVSEDAARKRRSRATKALGTLTRERCH